MTNYPASVFWHCCLGRQTCKTVVCEMTCHELSCLLNLT